ncbi:uncharacterized protein H6S33_002857 [Morchella sextelata]|uniref:uncharacterized protein n=1 Tax=Morchella sextelata TaxID=1174677 RepID=UPI001D0575E1|nr:uncharacterized protein H6S33_002857 [Morchella sextelata]KAH0607823.1 hypothetical protein H6S33_002857 [Morchella sextelata]
MELPQIHDRRKIKNHDGDIYDLINEDDRVYGINTIGYPTAERPVNFHREVDSQTSDAEIEEWFKECRTTVGEAAATESERMNAKRLIYTWRDIFEDDLGSIPECRIALHYIPTYPGSIPHKATNPLYTAEEMAWMRENLPKMCDSGILTVSNSQWSSKPKFVRRKNGTLRMVHVFCRLNKATIKLNTPMKRIEPILHNLMQSRFKCYWQADASVGYWGVPLAREHAYKTAFNTPLGQFCYLRMGMGLSGAAHTYARMKDILTGPIPSPHAEAGISGS